MVIQKQPSKINDVVVHLIDHLPGFAGCTDLDRKFVYMNDATAVLMGFKNKEAAIGTGLGDEPCKMSECADIFAQQNEDVVISNSSSKIIDIHPYAHDVVRSFLTHKFPLHNAKNELIGVIFNMIDINRTDCLNMCMAIASLDKSFRNKNQLNQRSYKIDNQFHLGLSNRELECLFYLVRGKTTAAIAATLNLSKRTVEFYINNIKNKMNCTSKSDLIEKAVANNFIDFIPQSLIQQDINISTVI